MSTLERRMSIDVERARSDTPACGSVLHFNNAGSALPPTPVVASQVGYLEREAAIGGYEAEAEAHVRIAHAYDAIATLIGCARDEIALVDSATTAWCRAFYGVPLGAGDRVLVSEAEYASNYIALLQVTRRVGAVIEVIPSDDAGQLSVSALRDAVDDRVRLIAITHVPTNSGLVNPAAEVGAIAREIGALYLLDACQSVGQLPIDVDEIGCDLLSATGRKYLRAPRGTGFLYVRRSALDRVEPPQLDLHAARWVAPDRYELRPDARRFETWERSLAGVVGLAAAADYALGWGLPAIAARVGRLADALRVRLADVPGVRVADIGARKCGIVSFAVDGAPGAVRDALRAQRINISVTDRNSTLIDMDRRGLTELCRASVHYYNTEDEVERFCAALAAVTTAAT